MLLPPMLIYLKVLLMMTVSVILLMLMMILLTTASSALDFSEMAFSCSRGGEMGCCLPEKRFWADQDFPFYS